MERKPRPLLDLLLSIVIPSIVLMRFSGDDDLGASGALVVALAFPIGLGLYELLRYRQTNYIAVLGLVSVLLTGGIGLLQLDTGWLAVKEASIPAVIGIAILVSERLGYPLVRVLIYNPKVLDTEKISRLLLEHGGSGTLVSNVSDRARHPTRCAVRVAEDSRASPKPPILSRLVPQSVLNVEVAAAFECIFDGGPGGVLVLRVQVGLPCFERWLDLPLGVAQQLVKTRRPPFVAFSHVEPVPDGMTGA